MKERGIYKLQSCFPQVPTVTPCWYNNQGKYCCFNEPWSYIMSIDGVDRLIKPLALQATSWGWWQQGLLYSSSRKPAWTGPSCQGLDRALRSKSANLLVSSFTASLSPPSPFMSTPKVVQTYLISRSLKTLVAGKPHASGRTRVPETPNIFLGNRGFL